MMCNRTQYSSKGFHAILRFFDFLIQTFPAEFAGFLIEDARPHFALIELIRYHHKNGYLTRVFLYDSITLQFKLQNKNNALVYIMVGLLKAASVI